MSFYDDDDEEYSYNLDVIEHGGGCCGMTHISDFPSIVDAENKKDRAAMIDAFDEALNDVGTNLSHCIEVVLIDDQLREGWLRIIQKRGFKRVSRFRNSNSNNVCNVFHRYGGYVPRYKGRKK